MNVGKPNFLFAAYAAALLVAMTGLVAMLYDLPIRDPDGVAATYFVLPLIVIGAIALDIVPRAFWRSPARSVGAAACRCRGGPGALGMGASPVRAGRARHVVPLVRRVPQPQELRPLRQRPAVGQHAGRLRPDAVPGSRSREADAIELFGTGLAAHFFSFVYVAWIVLVPVSLAIALVWSRNARAGSWYVTAIAVDWALGIAAYFVVPSLGPAYTSPGVFASLPDTWVSGLITGMMDDRQDVLIDPFAADSVQTIAAFPSLHVAITMTACLMAHLLGLPRYVRVATWVFLGLTVISTMYFGWHFFVDTIGGAAVGAAAVVDLGVRHGQPRAWLAAATRRGGHRGSTPSTSPTLIPATRGALRVVGALRGVGVLRARPEEPAQSVALRARYDVQVQVGDRLADGVVHRHERALCSEPRDDRRGQSLGGRQEAVSELGGQVRQGHDVQPRDQQDVALEHRPAVEEGHELVVLEDDIGLRVGLPCRDRTEQAPGHNAEPSGLLNPARSPASRCRAGLAWSQPAGWVARASMVVRSAAASSAPPSTAWATGSSDLVIAKSSRSAVSAGPR